MQLAKEEVLNLVKKNHWNIQGFNAYPLYLHCAATVSGWMVGDVLGAGYTHFFYLFSNNRARMHYDEEDWRRIGEEYFKRVANTSSLTELIKKYEDDYKIFQEKYPAPNRTPDSFDELLLLALGLTTRLAHATGFAHGIEGITYVGEHKLRSILEAKGGFDEVTFSKLSSPTVPSFLSDARKDLWKIKNASSEHQDTLITAFLAQWSWIENTYLGQPNFTRELVLKRAAELVNEPDMSEFTAIAQQKETIMTERSFTPEDKFVVETIDRSFSWQDDRKHNILETIGFLDPVMHALARAIDIDSAALKFATSEELTSEKLFSDSFKETLMDRRKGSAVYTTPEGTVTYTGSDFEFFTKELHVEFGNDISEFKGVSASKGVAMGIARVCESVSDIARVQEGEILVASMTRPEYLPAMQKAAAFVTDEGGVTCHAAIVAREMKKPCVIGTRTATRVIKDGDTVEVDADKGMVRILSRAE